MNTSTENHLSKKLSVAEFVAATDVKYPLQAITDLSLKDAVYLMVFIRSAKSINRQGHIGPITYVPPLAPYDYDKCMGWRYLSDRKLLTLSPSSEASVLTIVDDYVECFNYIEAKWKLHLVNFESTLLELNASIENSTWPPRWRYEVKAVWLDIALLECCEFLTYLANDRQFEIEITEDITSNILFLLRHYSVSHCFSIMRDGARTASDYVVQEKLCQQDAGQNILKYALQQCNNEKQFTAESRPYMLPQSQLSYVFHYDFLKIGAAGFSDIPHGLLTDC